MFCVAAATVDCYSRKEMNQFIIIHYSLSLSLSLSFLIVFRLHMNSQTFIIGGATFDNNIINLLLWWVIVDNYMFCLLRKTMKVVNGWISTRMGSVELAFHASNVLLRAVVDAQLAFSTRGLPPEIMRPPNCCKSGGVPQTSFENQHFV